jgi:hypothetical protein
MLIRKLGLTFSEFRIMQAWKNLPAANGLAYFATASEAKEKVSKHELLYELNY